MVQVVTNWKKVVTEAVVLNAKFVAVATGAQGPEAEGADCHWYSIPKPLVTPEADKLKISVTTG
jgi:hypothetical protein